MELVAMREKYVEERFNRYFVFGTHRGGEVDVACAAADTLATVSKEQAEALIADRDKVLNMLVKVALKLDEVAPDEFNKLWYGG